MLRNVFNIVMYLLLCGFSSEGQTFVGYDSLQRVNYEMGIDSSITIITHDATGNVTGRITHDPCSTKPRPHIVSLSSTTICSGDTAVIASSTTALKYQWVRVGDTAVVNDTIQTKKATANGDYFLKRLDTFSYPIYNFQRDTIQCYLGSDTIHVTVKPRPNQITPSSQAKCNGTLVDSTQFTSDILSTYAWVNTDTSIGLADSGSGTIPSFVGRNSRTIPDTAIITVTPLSNGCTGPSRQFSITVNPIPALTSTLVPPPVCDSSIFSYLPTSATPGVVFTWSRAAVSGISNPSSTGIGNPNEALVNATPSPIVVTYVDTLSALGCVNTQTVTVTVNPKPILSSPLILSPICDSTLFSYTPTSLTSGAVFHWNRAMIAGISNPAVTDTGAMSEFLNNISPNPITVIYADTLIANGCSNMEDIAVTVNPRPILSSLLVPSAICDSTLFSYIPTSLTAGTVFNWSRAAIIGISNAAAIGSGNPSEILVNTTPLPLTVAYVFTLTANGCSNTQTVTVVVNPKPLLTSTLTPPAICDSTTFSYTSLSSTPGTSFTWNRPLVTGISNPSASGAGNPNETLINSTNDPVTVTYVDTLSANGCTNIGLVSVVVNPKPQLSSSPAPPSICDSTLFSYTPTSLTAGVSFSWSRASVSGITEPSGSGTGDPNEVLENTTPNPINVVYIDTLTANGCSNTESVIVTVNPKPLFTSLLYPPTICDSTNFSYVPTSATAGTSFSWTRAAVAGITNASNSGAGNPNEVLVNVTYSPIRVIYAYTLTANGCPNAQDVTVAINPRPVFGSVTTPPAICDSTLFSYAPYGPVTGTAFNWTRAAMPGIANPAAAGVGDPNEIIVNSTPDSIAVMYSYTLTASGCDNIQNVWITVYPHPILSSSTVRRAVCDSSLFSYTPTSLTGGTTFAWSRTAELGISNAAASGINNPNETLKNTTPNQVTVVYIYTLTANSCSNVENVQLTVNPTPLLTGNDTATICSGALFTYPQSSSTPGTNFAWEHPNVPNITPSILSGTGDISEVLLNGTLTPIIVIYYDTLTAFGCSNVQHIALTVDPVPPSPVISTKPSSSVCANTQYQNFGALFPATAGVEYSWSATNAAIWAAGAGNQYCIANFLNPAVDAVIRLSSNVVGIGCYSSDSFTVSVSDIGSGISETPEVIYANPQFICLSALKDSYQWGYDDVATLDSTILAGEINQHYYNDNPDFLHKYYWVITTHNGCLQKSYENAPAKIVNGSPQVSAVNYFPNPTENLVNVEISGIPHGSFEVRAFDMYGQLLQRTAVNGSKAQISLRNYASGSYLISCYQDGIRLSSKVIIKR